MLGTEELYAELQRILEEEAVQAESPYDEVNKAMIRHWGEAMRNANPLYMDEEYAKQSEYGNIIAPPEMALTWSMAPWWPPSEQKRNPFRKAIDTTDENGYDGLIGTETSFEFYLPLHPGEKVKSMVKLDAVSSEKTTVMGTGFFVTGGYYYYNEKGELVTYQRFTVFKFKRPQENAA